LVERSATSEDQGEAIRNPNPTILSPRLSPGPRLA
jgi:hypothetical protein